MTIEPGSARARLVGELWSLAREEGVNVTPWPGLTIDRSTRPTHPNWNELQPLSLGIVAATGGAVTVVGEPRGARLPSYLVVGAGRRLDQRVLLASSAQPIVVALLRIDPKLVRSVSACMCGPERPDQRTGAPAASVLDDELADTVLRFLGALTDPCDRRVLAPLHLRELVFRLLQREQRGCLVQLAAREEQRNPVSAAMGFISAHLAEPLTVETLAAQACLSPSAFSRAFRERTGRSPYQYVKEKRLDRARHLLGEQCLGVTDVARAVGYTSVSHFIKEFRGRFGETPGGYAAAQRGWERLSS